MKEKKTQMLRCTATIYKDVPADQPEKQSEFQDLVDGIGTRTDWRIKPIKASAEPAA